MKPVRVALIAVVSIAAVAEVAAAESYQPTSHVTRGIYANIGPAMQGSVWGPWGDGFTYVDDGAHGGQSCVPLCRQGGRP